MNTEYQPLLTIAVPTYNGAKTIRNMLNILLPQVDERVEVLISDNCSIDETPQIIEDYKKKYPLIQTFRNETNLGPDENFLKCARLAKGKFTLLFSDDDILIEGSLRHIISFLEENGEVSLVFLYTVGFRDRYIDSEHCQKFIKYSKEPRADFCTTDKKDFIKYVGRQFGFLSSFIWATGRFQKIKNPEKFFNSYWLQGYLQILCSDKVTDLLGIIAGPCVAAGHYGIIANYDSAKVEVLYKKMLDYAVRIAGYDRKQLNRLWLWHVCFLTRRAIIKENSIGVHITSKKLLFKTLCQYPYAWFHLFPFMLIPASVCRVILNIVRKLQGRSFTSFVNRPIE